MTRINITNFVDFRENAGFSQRKLSLQAGLSAGTVSKIEQTKSATEETLKKIADILGVRVSDLTAGDRGQGLEIRESQATYGGQAPTLFELNMAKAKRANLTGDEVKQLKGAITQLVDIYTIIDTEKRQKYRSMVEAIIKCCHETVFPEGGWEGKSFDLKEDYDKGQSD